MQCCDVYRCFILCYLLLYNVLLYIVEFCSVVLCFVVLYYIMKDLCLCFDIYCEKSVFCNLFNSVVLDGLVCCTLWCSFKYSLMMLLYSILLPCRVLFLLPCTVLRYCVYAVLYIYCTDP